jgi:crotonobetainyl-CoA:carnitine CoA-transferase CaiB-like acyl-CoA transferase
MKILEGIKVIDVTAWAFVPSAAGVMAHWGADVIKVESPGAPDPMRLIGGSLEPGESSASFKHYSRGKRSIGINLAASGGQELIYRLASTADVFITSYLAPTRQKLKIDVEDIRKVNPKIIYARGSGYGPKGPDANRPGYDSISWWSRGSLAQSAMDEAELHWPMGMVGHGDGISGLVFAGGICAALLHRERTGEAKVVDSSLMGTAVWFNGLALMAAQSGPRQRAFAPAQRIFPPDVRPQFRTATICHYQTKDFRFIYLMFLGDDDRDFVDLCRRLDRPQLATDERFVNSSTRLANCQALIGILEGIFAAKTLEEWKAILGAARGAWSIVQTPEEVYSDPQTLANGFLRHVDYPNGGLKVPCPPILFDEEAGNPPRAPDFAEHTDQILGELGCGAEDIARYRAAGVVA